MFKKQNNFLLKRSHQVVYGIVLTVLVPVFIMLNTLWIIDTSTTNIYASVQRQALMIGKLFDSTIYEGSENRGELQAKVEKIIDSDLDLRNIDILLKEGDKFRIIVSSDKNKIGNFSEDLNYVISWYQDEAVATLISDKRADNKGSERLWELAMPLKNDQGEKEAIISLRLSFNIVEDLVKDTLTKAIVILVITMLIVIFLLALNSRLFEHAILFRKLKEVDKMKDEFISIASHELRTPITTLKGFLSMILEGDYGELDEKGKKGLKIMEASVNRLGSLVEDLLNVSRIEQNRLAVDLKAIRLAEILESLEAEFELRVKEKGLKFKLIKVDNLPKIWVDEDKLRQILVNLIGNAVKYTKKGEIELIARADDNKFVTLNVKDTGLGMNAKEREGLFEKFYRIQDEETKGIVGTGLGLWITKQLVELMGGKIYVDSIKHVGSQFYFTVPIYNKLVHKEKPKEEPK